MSEAKSPPAVETEQPLQPTLIDEIPPGRQSTGPTGLPLVVALVSLILAFGLAVAAYFIWHQVQHLVTEQAGVEAGVGERIQPLRASLDSINQSLQDERRAVEARVHTLEEDQQSISHRISLLAALMGRSERGWTLAEVEYLLRIANQRLQLQRDVSTAEQALQAAD